MRKLIWPLILILILCGCSVHQEQVAVAFEDAALFPTESITEFPVLDVQEGSAAQQSDQELYTDFGKIYCVQNESRDYILSLSDYEAGECYPLCPKSNCRHDSGDCGAYFSFAGGQPAFLHYDGSQLYFFRRSDMILQRQRIDGSGRETVADLSEDVFSVNTILYEQETAWLLCELMDVNEDTSELTIRKTVVELDLTTGKWAELPYAFEGDMTNVELYGKYGDELLMRYSDSTSAIPFQNPEDTRYIVFLFNVETGEITQLTEYAFTYVSSAQCPGYLLYCVFDPESEYEVSYCGEAWSAYSGELLIFDLAERVCYRMESDCLTWEFSIRDGKLFYCELDDDGVSLEGKIRDLETGAVMDWAFFDSEPRLRWLTETEGWFIVMDGDIICRITKEDYYAGNRELLPIP